MVGFQRKARSLTIVRDKHFTAVCSLTKLLAFRRIQITLFAGAIKISLDSGVQEQLDRSSLLREITVGPQQGCSTPYLLSLLGLASPSSRDFNFFALILPHLDMSWPLLPNLTHPKYPVNPEAPLKFL
ncbi:hypothetical protein J6590_027569 [Homalodisca vitripennis]|nr:hypothetical protein J6590_027569 [Homalodisca vitripennis]